MISFSTHRSTLPSTPGFFRARQLDVSLVSTGGDEKTWAAVIGGSASFGVADPGPFVAIAEARGQQGRVVASIVDGVPFWGITYKADVTPFASAKDLKSYAVATLSVAVYGLHAAEEDVHGSGPATQYP